MSETPEIDFSALRSRWAGMLSDDEVAVVMASLRALAAETQGACPPVWREQLLRRMRAAAGPVLPGPPPPLAVYLETVSAFYEIADSEGSAGAVPLLLLAVDACSEGIARYLCSPGDGTCAAAGLSGWAAHTQRLLECILRALGPAGGARGGSWGCELLLQSLSTRGCGTSVVELFRALLPVVECVWPRPVPRCSEGPCEHCDDDGSQRFKRALLDCFDAVMNVMVAYFGPSVDATAVSVLLGACVSRELRGSAVQTAMLTALCGLVGGEDSDLTRCGSADAVWPPQGRPAGHPSSLLFATAPSGEPQASWATLSHKIPRFIVLPDSTDIAREAELTVRDSSHADSHRSVLGVEDRGRYWSPLLCPFSIGAWFKVDGSGRGRGTYTLCSFKNDFEEISVLLKNGSVVVSLSVSVVVDGGVDVVGIDIEYPNSADSTGALLSDGWNHVFIVQSDGNAGATSMSMRAYLNGLSLKETSIVLPHVKSFEAYAVHPTDPRMEYEVSFGLDTGVGDSCDDYQARRLDIASLVVLDKAIYGPDVLALVAAGPRYKSTAFAGDVLSPCQRGCVTDRFIDLSVCPASIWKNLVISDLAVSSDVAELDPSALPGDMKGGASPASGQTTDGQRPRPGQAVPSRPDRHKPMAVTVGVSKPCRVVLTISNEWSTPVTGTGRHCGCILSSGALVPTMLRESGRSVLLLPWPTPPIDFVLDGRTTLQLVSQLMSQATNAQSFCFALKFLSAVLYCVPEYRVQCEEDAGLLRILSTFRSVAKTREDVVDSSAACYLLSLAGSTVGCQDARLSDWESFAIIDSAFFSDVLCDLELWTRLPFNVYQSTLRLASDMLCKNNSSVGKKVGHFSANKLQLRKGRVLRALLRGLLDMSVPVSQEHVSAVSTFLFYFFCPIDGLCRTYGCEDDFAVILSVFHQVCRIAGEGRLRGSEDSAQEHNTDQLSPVRCFMLARAFSSLLYQVATTYAVRLRSMSPMTSKIRDVNIPRNAPHSPTGLSRVDCGWQDPSSSPITPCCDTAEMASPGSELARLKPGGDGCSPIPPHNRRNPRPSSVNFDLEAQKLSIQSENVARCVKYLIAACPVSRGVHLLAVSCSAASNGWFPPEGAELVLNWVRFLTAIAAFITTPDEVDELQRGLCDITSFCLNSVIKCARRVPMPLDKEDGAEKASVVFNSEFLSFWRFLNPNVGYGSKVTCLYSDTETADCSVADSASAVVWTTGLAEGFMDLLLGGHGRFRSMVSSLCDGWSFSDVEPGYTFGTAAEPPLGYRQGFEAVIRRAADGCGDIESHACCLGVATSQRLLIEIPGVVPDRCYSFQYIDVIVQLLLAAARKTSVASVICTKDCYTTILIPPQEQRQSEHLDYCDVLGAETGAVLKREVETAVSLCVSVMCALTSLWTRSPEFQCALISEPAFRHLRVLVGGIIQLFYAASRARLMEIIFLDVLKNHAAVIEAGSLSGVNIFESLIYQDFVRTYDELDTTPTLFSNLLLYRSCGSVVCRLCLQFLTAIGDSFFLWSLPCSWSHISGPAEGHKSNLYSSVRSLYGEAGKDFLDVLEQCMDTRADVEGGEDPEWGRPPGGKYPSALVIPASLLLNSAVRRRMLAASSARLLSWVEVAEDCLGDSLFADQYPYIEEDFSRVAKCISTLSRFTFLIISLETELSRRMTGPEINFDSRVVVPINDLLCMLRAVRGLSDHYHNSKLGKVPCDDTGGTGGGSYGMEPLKSSFGASVSGLFRRKPSDGQTGSTADSSNRSIGGMMGKLIEKGIHNISTVSDGLTKLRGRHATDEGSDNSFVVTMTKAVVILRCSFVYVLEFHRRAPVVLAKILPVLFSAGDLIFSWKMHDSKSIFQMLASQNLFTILSKQSSFDFETAFMHSCCGVLLHILCNSTDAVATTMAAVCWGRFLTESESVSASASMRELLVVDVFSPNDSTTRMKLDLWKFDAIGFSRLASIAEEYRHQNRECFAPITSQSISGVVENTLAFKEWFLSTPESLRESFRTQLSRAAMPFVKSTKLLCDNAMKGYILKSNEPQNSVGVLKQGFHAAPLQEKEVQVFDWLSEVRKWAVTTKYTARSGESIGYFIGPRLMFIVMSCRSLHHSDFSSFTLPPPVLHSFPWRVPLSTTERVCPCCRMTPPLRASLSGAHAAHQDEADLSSSFLQDGWPDVAVKVQPCRFCGLTIASLGSPRPDSNFVAIATIITNSNSRIGDIDTASSSSSSILLSDPICRGDWALDNSESYLRTRKRLRRSPFVILRIEDEFSRDEKLPSEAARVESGAGDEAVRQDALLTGLLKPVEDVSDTDTDNSSGGDYCIIDADSSGDPKMFNSPARGCWHHDWEDCEDDSAERGSNGVAGAKLLDSPNGNAVFMLPSSNCDIISDVAADGTSILPDCTQPSLNEPEQCSGLPHSPQQAANSCAKETASNLESSDVRDAPPLCRGEKWQQSFSCNLVLGMDHRASECVLSDKKLYIFGCYTNKYGHKKKIAESRSQCSQIHRTAPEDTPKKYDVSVEIADRSDLESALVSAMVRLLGFETGPSGRDDVMIPFRDVMGVHRRRYLLAHKAVELFLISGRSLFLAFQTTELRNAFCAELLKKCPHIASLDICVSVESSDDIFLTTPLGMTPLAAYWYHRQNQLARSPLTGAGILSASGNTVPLHVVSLQGATDRWVRGLMSNFEYIMTLNTYSGRSYNDWAQYPVFPWVLKDYTSDTLDLNDVSVFRDLSKPMGALHEVREKEARNKYELLQHQASRTGKNLSDDEMEEDMTQPISPFHYGTHYSSTAAVLHFMVRLQPFAAHAIAFQGGRKFDKPDRLFQSVARSWLSASGGLTALPETRTGNLQDVKELIPEFYYLPDFLVNVNAYNFGENSNGRPVGDVELPPWANNSPTEFIRIHREALESPYVTSRLHKWIDLIFGYKQRGTKAVKACNIFHHMSYEGGIDVDSIGSAEEREACLQQLRDFGQTPAQIFQSGHPPCKAKTTHPSGSLPEAVSTTREPKSPSNTDVVPACVITTGVPPIGKSSLIELPGAKIKCLKMTKLLKNHGPWHTPSSHHEESGASSSLGHIIYVSESLPVTPTNPQRKDSGPLLESSLKHNIEFQKLKLTRSSHLVLCPLNSVFIPWYDVTAPSMRSNREASNEPTSWRAGVGMTGGIIAVWGFADSTFKLFCNNFVESSSDDAGGSGSEVPEKLYDNWKYISSVHVPDVSISCGASSNSGRLLFTGHSDFPIVHKWRVYPIKRSVNRCSSVSAARTSVYCSVVLVDTVPCASHIGGIVGIAVSVCNGIFVSSCSGGNIIIWTIDTLQQTKICSWNDLATPISAAPRGVNDSFCSTMCSRLVSCITVETTTGYIYYSCGRSMIVCDSNGNTLGWTTDSRNLSLTSDVVCLCPLSDVEHFRCSAALFSVLAGYRDGTVVLWQCDGCSCSGNDLTPTVVGEMKCIETLPLVARRWMVVPEQLPVRSLSVPRAGKLSEAPTNDKNIYFIDISVGLADGRIFIWELEMPP